MGGAPLRPEAGQPGQQAQVHRHRGRLRPGRRLGRGHPGRARLQRQVLLLPGQPAPRPLDRRPGRHQRRQELPERRRQRLPPVLRHGQGRRLPRPRGQRLPPGRGQRQHHRPVRRPGRALRPRVRRPARQPLLRRRPGLAHLLRPRPDRPAAAARRLPGARAADRRRQGQDVPAHRDARPGRRSTAAPRGIVTRDLVTGKIESPRRPTRWCWPPAATATSSTCRPTPRARNVTAIWRAHKRGALLRQPLLHADPPDLHPGLAATTSRSSR